MAKVVTMGEIMLRLSTPGNQKYIQATQFDINYGGGEANVAVLKQSTSLRAATDLVSTSLKQVRQ